MKRGFREGAQNGALALGGANNNTKTFYTPGVGATLTMGSILLAPPGGRVDYGGAT